jgi:hypothetical protein
MGKNTRPAGYVGASRMGLDMHYNPKRNFDKRFSGNNTKKVQEAM